MDNLGLNRQIQGEMWARVPENRLKELAGTLYGLLIRSALRGFSENWLGGGFLT